MSTPLAQMRLRALLNPSSIAIVGASTDGTRIGGIAIKLLNEAAFRNVYPINPKHAEIQGRRCYPDIESVPAHVDLVLVAISAEDTLDYLERCHKRGVNAAIVYAAGYAETNEPDGISRQTLLVEFAKRTGMVVGGPNCMGNVNLPHKTFSTFGTSFPSSDPPGHTALVTQSGNMCAVLYRMARKLGVAFSHVINTGNEANVDLADYLEFLAEDPETDSALCYLEAVRDGEKFLRAAQAFRRQNKLLAIFKVGSTQKGAEAAQSHTAALAGNREAYAAAFRACGVASVSELSTLSDLAYLHRFRTKPAGSKCAVMTVSGAGGAILADAICAEGGTIPTLSTASQASLRECIPAYGMVSNPVDLTGNLVNCQDFLWHALETVLDDDCVETLIVFMPGYFMAHALPHLKHVAEITKKSIVAIDVFAQADRATIEQAGIAYFEDVNRAAKAIVHYGRWREAARALGTSGNEDDSDARLRWATATRTSTKLSEFECKRLLAEFGVPITQYRIVRSELEAQEAAATMRTPLVAKIVSADVPHKTEFGLIKLNLLNASSVRKAYADIMENAKVLPGIRIDGVALEWQLQRGVEILVGAIRDDVFGWMLTIGTGGVLTELLGDVSHRLLPVDQSTAMEMLRELKAYPLLEGYRGAPPADIVTAAEAIAAIARAVASAPDSLKELEINPLIVLPRGEGCAAADALMRFDTSSDTAR